MLKKSNRIFLNLENLDQNLFCSICFEVFEDPCTLSCTHTFCYVCIVQERSIRKSCPLCRNTQLIFDPKKNQSKCSHENCKWTGRYHQLKGHQRSCEYKPYKQQKIINRDVINVIIDDQMQKNVEKNAKGKKKIKVDQKEYYEIYFQFQPQQRQGNSLLPPILEPINFPRPVQSRFFERQESLVPRAQYINGTSRNPIIIDIQDNENAQSKNPNHLSPKETIIDRLKKSQQVNQDIKKVMTRSQQKKHFQELRFLLQRPPIP